MSEQVLPNPDGTVGLREGQIQAMVHDALPALATMIADDRLATAKYVSGHMNRERFASRFPL